MLTFGLFAAFSSAALAQQEHLYYFNEAPYVSTSGTAPVMVPIGDVTTPVTVTIPATTCPDEPVIDVSRFEDNSGFAAKAFFSHTYSIEVIFQFDEMSGYNRIIDFSNSASDNGIYIYNTCLNFYPIGSIGDCPDAFDPVNYKQLVITRDGSTQAMNVYLNGELFTSHVDAEDHYVIGAAPSDSIKFFRDDNMIGNEASSGHVVMIRMADNAISEEEVQESFANFCTNILASVPDGTGSSLNVRPNPAASIVTVEVPADLQQIEIRDMNGRLLLHQLLRATDRIDLNVEALPDGIYILSGHFSDQSIMNSRLIVAH